MSGGEWDYCESQIRNIGESESMREFNPLLADLLISVYDVVVSADLRICGDIGDEESAAAWNEFCKKWSRMLEDASNTDHSGTRNIKSNNSYDC